MGRLSPGMECFSRLNCAAKGSIQGCFSEEYAKLTSRALFGLVGVALSELLLRSHPASARLPRRLLVTKNKTTGSRNLAANLLFENMKMPPCVLRTLTALSISVHLKGCQQDIRSASIAGCSRGVGRR